MGSELNNLCMYVCMYFRLLGVWLPNILSQNVVKILKKANSRIYALRIIGLWSALPRTLWDIFESIQERALKVAYPTYLTRKC